ncbi:DBH-like monooxygenase protein 2 homolog [Plectropomus leopardus]|uniref:DBH-like monooxygenase protein 2 homolog n=1 Tax=Plectropomus leopardus TaxID=160734 RepID=UPI001C4DAB15|nr:DBH-like monooxygenase protein 2 homolog [Plectropomus leopardus]
MLSLLSLLCLFLVWTKGAGAVDSNLPFMDYLDQNHLVCLKWGFDNHQGNITFKLIVNTTGWVSFGFSPNGGMKGSDIVIGGVGSSGTYFSDRHATGNTMPVVDDQQSYTLLSLNESDGQTIMTVQRPIQLCDDQDFYIPTQSVKVIYAYGNTDDIVYHGALRGTKEINLLNFNPKTTITSPNYISARVENIAIPPIHTYYHCKLMKFPTLTAKKHIFQIEPVIENVDLVHHMLLYSCPSYVTELYDRPCYMGDIGDVCFGVVAAWGMGGGVFEFPKDTGIPIGEDNEKIFRLEIHYNNPGTEAGRTDSSGLKLHYTAPRKYDVATLQTGLMIIPHMAYNIPPKAAQFHSYGVCNTSLFSQLMNPVPDLHVFAVMLHTHTAGRKVRVVLYRGGKLIEHLAADADYDFQRQESISLGTIKTIKLGDEIAVECTYNTTNRTEVTRMGLATTDEMCLAFLLYYPAIKITLCESHPNTRVSMGSTTSEQEDIAAQETFLKSIKQMQFVSDDNYNFGHYEHGFVREMTKTPKVTCQSGNTASRLRTSFIVNPAGVVLLLLWIVMM